MQVQTLTVRGNGLKKMASQCYRLRINPFVGILLANCTGVLQGQRCSLIITAKLEINEYHGPRYESYKKVGPPCLNQTQLSFQVVL